jgi:hypothetical protein
MSDDDWKAFQAALLTTAALVGRRLTPDVAAGYFRALDDLPLAALLAALRHYARTVESGARFLTPVELRRRVTAGPQTRAVPPTVVSRPDEPLVTPEQMVRTLWAIAPRAAPRLRADMLALAQAITERACGSLTTITGPLAAAVRARLAREPGSDDATED